MSKLYKRSDSSYYWWTAVLNGLRLRKSTMMTKKSLALKIKDVWDVKMVLGDMSFIKEEKQELQGIESYIEDYLVFLENRKSENTVLIAKGVFKKFIRFLNEQSIDTIEGINVKILNQYIDWLEVMPKTKKNHMSIISLMLNQAVVDGFLKKNPAKQVTLPRIKKNNIHRLLTEHDLNVIFKYAGMWFKYYKFLLFTGLRAGDVAMLRYCDIDMDKKVITTLVRKSDRIHGIPLAKPLIDEIDNNISLSPIFPEIYSDNDRKRNDNLAKPRKHKQKILRQHNLEKADLHSFRVTFNCILRDKGLSIDDRRQLLAHSSSETTRIYTHPNLELALDFVNQIPDYSVLPKNVTKT